MPQLTYNHWRSLADQNLHRKAKPIRARLVKLPTAPRLVEKEPLTPGLRPKERSHVETFGFYPLREGEYGEDSEDAGRAGRNRKAR